MTHIPGTKTSAKINHWKLTGLGFLAEFLGSEPGYEHGLNNACKGRIFLNYLTDAFMIFFWRCIVHASATELHSLWAFSFLFKWTLYFSLCMANPKLTNEMR